MRRVTGVVTTEPGVSQCTSRVYQVTVDAAPVTRVTCHGNPDSLRLVLARAVACRA